VNDVLDQLEWEHFFNADVFILPPENVVVVFWNGESDGDSEDSDEEQLVARPFADHLTPQILKDEGSAAFVDDGGCHEIERQSDEQSTSEEQSGTSVSAVGTSTSLQKRKKRQLNPNTQSKHSKLPSQRQTEVEVARAEPVAVDIICRAWEFTTCLDKSWFKFRAVWQIQVEWWCQ